MAQRLCAGDEVVVIAGSHKGRKGKILKVFNVSQRATVEGVNLVTSHKEAAKRSDQRQKPAQREAAIHLSNIMLVHKSTGKPARVSFSVTQDGSKTRLPRGTRSVADGAVS